MINLREFGMADLIEKLHAVGQYLHLHLLFHSEIVGKFSKDYGFPGPGRKACELAPHTGAVASSDDAK